ncbi:nitrate reductase cytochrome c-type subunit [Pseudomarimonas arenosa]|uniref:Periplasmic nitrate reductase, electron transfer subunit n=1 Tax=Pseudomarimonas arenosa TaxID=2774145 RepID=A0AAW3ZPM5_9GAMM|nr:nitrate reductase cytochrome c-type subunit [Pseudomarimonas arenosa]MBD8527465.1 nitrate reductase cytochrome c-type subunit [Pseudomarimonas arenosa]
MNSIAYRSTRCLSAHYLPRGLLGACLLALASTCGFAQDPNADAPAPPEQEYRSIDALRRGAPLATEPAAAPMATVENTDLKRARGWPEQPPTIPHAIDGYQVDKNSNRCLLCHTRANAAQFQAPMLSVTHFMDRDGQVLAQISARRYFCVQCHVVQTDAKPLVVNTFVDVDQLLQADSAPEEH